MLVSFDCYHVRTNAPWYLPFYCAAALLALYESANGAEWTRQANWGTSQNPCSPPWEMVTCKNGSVVEL